MGIVELLSSLGQVFDALAVFLPKMISFCAVLAAFMPPLSGGFGGMVYKAVNYMAFNVGHATNQVKAND